MGLAMEHGGAYTRAGGSSRGCWYYLRYFFLFVSLIQFLIILGLVLFMVYGNVHESTESNLQATKLRADSLHNQLQGLSGSHVNLTKELNLTARARDSIMQMLLVARRDVDRINASFRQCLADRNVYMNNQKYMAAIILSEKQCQEQLKETNNSCNGPAGQPGGQGEDGEGSPGQGGQAAGRVCQADPASAGGEGSAAEGARQPGQGAGGEEAGGRAPQDTAVGQQLRPGHLHQGQVAADVCAKTCCSCPQPPAYRPSQPGGIQEEGPGVPVAPCKQRSRIQWLRRLREEDRRLVPTCRSADLWQRDTHRVGHSQATSMQTHHSGHPWPAPSAHPTQGP